MNTATHTDYRHCVFRDTSSGFTFLTRSTCKSDATIQWEDGNTYPLITVEISSASHPAYTGIQRKATSEGRVALYHKRFGRSEEQLP